jgi:serine/threonine-protein phosphatase 5
MKNKVFIGSVKNVYVAGDLHGDYESFKKILNGYEKSERDSLLLFLGDYADRGFNGLEIIMELNKLLDTRKDIVSLKGNHEMYVDGMPTFSPCDLIYEAQEKYTSWKKFYHDIMIEFLAKLHIAAIINNVLFIHAGISSEVKTMKDLTKHENEVNLLWSDPSSLPGEHPNIRGAGVTFGEDVTTKVLSSLDLKMIIRSHEPRKAAFGPCVEHGGKVITTNSCASYGEPWKPFMLKVDTESLKYESIFL